MLAYILTGQSKSKFTTLKWDSCSAECPPGKSKRGSMSVSVLIWTHSLSFFSTLSKGRMQMELVIIQSERTNVKCAPLPHSQQ